MCTDKEVKSDAISKDVFAACEKFGAYKVRKAAIQQMKGNSRALATVGLNHQYSNEHLLFISHTAFDQMTDDEIHHESCLNLGIEYWPLNNEWPKVHY